MVSAVICVGRIRRTGFLWANRNGFFLETVRFREDFIIFFVSFRLRGDGRLGLGKDGWGIQGEKKRAKTSLKALDGSQSMG